MTLLCLKILLRAQCRSQFLFQRFFIMTATNMPAAASDDDHVYVIDGTTQGET